jgi:hypothetical protein
MSEFFMSEAVYREMQAENTLHAGGWSSQFNTYEDACRFYGLPTPAQERAEIEADIEQWFSELSPDEQAAYVQHEMRRALTEMPAYFNRYQPDAPVTVTLNDDPFAPTIDLSPISVQLCSGQIVHKQLYDNDLTPDGREIGYINVWIHRIPVYRLGLTDQWEIDVDAVRAMMQA